MTEPIALRQWVRAHVLGWPDTWFRSRQGKGHTQRALRTLDRPARGAFVSVDMIRFEGIAIILIWMVAIIVSIIAWSTFP